MGGSRRTETQTQQQNQQTINTSGAAQAGDRAIPGLEAAFTQAQNIGTYQGNFIAPNANYTGPTVAVPGTPTGPRFATDPNYTGPIRAAPNAGQIGGAEGLINFGQSQIAPTQTFVNTGQNYANNIVSGANLDPNNNPALQAYIQSLRTGAGISAAQRINQMRDQSVEGGAYGGTGYYQGLALAEGEQARALEDATSALLYQNYGDEQARIERMPQFFAALQALGATPYSMMTAGGNQQNSLDQIGIDNTRSSYEAGRRNEQVNLDNSEWLRQELAAIRQAELENARYTYGANAANEQDSLDNALMQHQAQLAGLFDPYGMYFDLLGRVPSTTTANSTGTSTTTASTPTASPWVSILGSALSWGANRFGQTPSPSNPNIQNRAG